MTRKDYELIAEAILAALMKGEPHGPWAIHNVVEELSKRLKNDNINFNKEKFLIACGFDPKE